MLPIDPSPIIFLDGNAAHRPVSYDGNAAHRPVPYSYPFAKEDFAPAVAVSSSLP